jgi:gamma-glutamylcyclotransferase (GGCT)/AIG2-like uncharacterized protein YtfP
MRPSKTGSPATGETFVFVYGTLREAVRGPVQKAVTEGWELVGHGTVAAELYDLGAYPGAVPSAAGGPRVWGELYGVPDAEEALPRLDHHEGCGPGHAPPHEFARALVDVTLESGETVEAWVYWYRWEPAGRLIGSGDYMTALRLARGLPKSRTALETGDAEAPKRGLSAG